MKSGLGWIPLNPETFGYPDAEYKYEYVVDADDPVLEAVNDNNEQYQMSFSVKGSGGAISEMLVRESAYANIIQQEYTLGCVPEILLLDNSDENEKFLCPVNTTVDAGNHCIQATVDEIGTYCILDIELWLCEIGFEVDSFSEVNEAENFMPAILGLLRGSDGKKSATEGGLVTDSESANKYDIQALSVKGCGEAEETTDRELVDIAFCINNNGDNQLISFAIMIEPRYIKDGKTYKWNSTTRKMEAVKK